MTDRLTLALAAIDTANLKDPDREPDETGTMQPKEWLYGRRMSAEMERLFGPEVVADVLKIAARGQHIERWVLKRAEFPEGRAGYLNWRREQGCAHGARLAQIMADAGYDAETCARVGVLLRKEGLKRDPEVQMLEDVICFVFLRHYFGPFAAKHPPRKVLDIVTKAARKMSAPMRERALDEFDLPPDHVAAIEAAS